MGCLLAQDPNALKPAQTLLKIVETWVVTEVLDSGIDRRLSREQICRGRFDDDNSRFGLQFIGEY
jgi:hypothetical protein